MRWTVPTPGDFDFRSAVCSHGFFMLAPNRWEPKTATLHTAVALDETSAVGVRVWESGRNQLEIRCSGKLSRSEADRVLASIRRMLRLDEDLSAFHRACRVTQYLTVRRRGQGDLHVQRELAPDRGHG